MDRNVTQLYTYISVFIFRFFFPCRLSESTEQSSLRSAVGPCCLSVLYTAVCWDCAGKCSDLGVELWEKAACCADLLWVVLSQGGECGLVSEGCWELGWDSRNPARVQCDFYPELPPCFAVGHWGLEESTCPFGIHQVSSPRTMRLHLLVSPRPPRNPTVASPRSGAWNVCIAFLSRIADQRACHLPQQGMLFIDFKSFWEPTFHGSLSKYCSS